MRGSLGQLQPDHSTPSPPHHFVNFYEPQAFPAEQIARYFLTGLEAGESSLLVATADHAEQIRECLNDRGADPEGLARAGLLFSQDANAMVDAFHAGTAHGRRKPSSFGLQRMISPVIAKAQNGKIRVFGELVDLLAAQGERQACLGLEREWKRLIAKRGFPLYRAYSNSNFSDAGSAEFFCAVCGVHDEAASGGSALAPDFWIAALRDRTLALQKEIGERKALERELYLGKGRARTYWNS